MHSLTEDAKTGKGLAENELAALDLAASIVAHWATPHPNPEDDGPLCNGLRWLEEDGGPPIPRPLATLCRDAADLCDPTYLVDGDGAKRETLVDTLGERVANWPGAPEDEGQRFFMAVVLPKLQSLQLANRAKDTKGRERAIERLENAGVDIDEKIPYRVGRTRANGTAAVTFKDEQTGGTWQDDLNVGSQWQRKKLAEGVSQHFGIPKYRLGWIEREFGELAARKTLEKEAKPVDKDTPEDKPQQDERALDKCREVLGDDFVGITQHGTEEAAWTLHWGETTVSLDSTEELYTLRVVRARMGDLRRPLIVDQKDWCKTVCHLFSIAEQAPGLTDAELIRERLADFVGSEPSFRYRYDPTELGRATRKTKVVEYDENGEPHTGMSGEKLMGTAGSVKSFVDLEGRLWLKFSQFQGYLSREFARCTKAKLAKALRKIGFEPDVRLPGRKQKGTLAGRRYWRLETWEE